MTQTGYQWFREGTAAAHFSGALTSNFGIMLVSRAIGGSYTGYYNGTFLKTGSNATTYTVAATDAIVI